MAAITAAMVKELRVKTDAPMMECKKALTEADGDMAKAEEILRVKLGNKATKAAARIAAEGVVAVYLSDDRKLGAILEVNSETDFVAKNPEFLQMAADAVRAVAEQNPADIEALAACKIGDATLEEVRKGLVGKIGENMTFRRFTRVEAKGELNSYIHGSKIGVIVDVIGGNAELSHDVAMHIAAAAPEFVSKDEIPAEKLEEERRIAREQVMNDEKNSKKPAQIIEKIVDGRIEKYCKEICLLDQPYVKDPDITIQTLLHESTLKTGEKVTIRRFVRYKLGEGLEKRADDFASEVASMVK